MHDTIEIAAYRSMLTTGAARQAGCRVVEVGGGVVLLAPGIDHVMFNRAIGVALEAWPEAVRLLRAGGRRFFLHGDGEAPAELDLVRYPRSWVTLERAPSPVAWPQAPPGLVLRDATSDDAAALGRIYCDAFDIPATAVPIVASIVGRSGWETVAVASGDDVVGIGLLFVRDGLGYLAGGATRPDHRRRGVQRTVVLARLSRAESLGVTRLYSETGEAKPGEEQHSYRNMERQGFRPLTVRHNYCPPGTRWGGT